jgi:hypothetical protein
MGTCYVATDPLVAVLEFVGPHVALGAIASATLDKRRLRRLALPRDRQLANLTSKRAAGHLTAEIFTITPYSKPQRWAEAFAASGHDGMQYFVRHDLVRRGFGIALFGRGGERTSWPRGRATEIGPELRQRLERECSIDVLDRPRDSQLAVVDD